MNNYIIHACPERMWYVEKYLIPSMKIQGIKDIDVRCDTEHIGNLESCMQIFASLAGDGGAWHMQDDVIICHDFRKKTEIYDYGVVCGFTSTASTKDGIVKPNHMWWSFPCIRIPNWIARECAEWFYESAKNADEYAEWIQMNKNDDGFFREFLQHKYPYMDVTNLKPNLVDHVDFLIGGSVVNRQRDNKRVQAQYFEDKRLVMRLSEKLRGVMS